MDKRKEPLIHITKRGAVAPGRAWAIRVGAIIAALLVCAVVTTLTTGINPFAVFGAIFEGAFGTNRKIWMLLQNMAILLCVSLAVTPAFKMRCWNLGAEGQVLIGGLATASCMILLRDALPGWLLIAVMVISAILAGAVWAGIPALFKA